MSMEKILREINYDIAINEVSEKAMEIGRMKPYYSNFVEKKEVKDYGKENYKIRDY